MNRKKDPSRGPSKSHEEVKAEKRRKQKARREARKAADALAVLYKPIEEWDEEELARGRVRASDGSFKGQGPRWVSREVHEEAVRRFTELATDDLRALVPKALETISSLILEDGLDEKGKPIVPPGVRAQCAQWVVEHLVGKPKQRLEADISVKLQGILATALVSPDDANGGYIPAIDVPSWTDDDDPLPGEESGE